jgi:hypothetical protein
LGKKQRSIQKEKFKKAFALHDTPIATDADISDARRWYSRMPPPCRISCIDVDGPGRRLEAAFTCAGAAEALGTAAEYVYAPLFQLQHGVSALATNEWFGLGRVFPSVYTRVAAPNEAANIYIQPLLPRLALAASPPPFDAVALRAAPDEHMMTRHTAPRLCSGFHTRRKQIDAATQANRSWLHGLEQNKHVCTTRTVYVHQDCAAYFWCTVVAERKGRAWYAVVERLQRGYIAAAASKIRQRAALLRPPHDDDDDDTIVVGVHIRTVKRRLWGMLTGHAYLDLIEALRARHRTHHHRHPLEGRRRGLRFVVHCDGGERGVLVHRPPICPSMTCGYELALHALRNFSDVDVRFQHFETKGGKRAASRSGAASVQGKGGAFVESGTEALYAMHDLMMSDVLILADSSFSLVPGMLGNITAFAPACGERALPHWVRVPCGHGMSAAEAEWMPYGLLSAGGRPSATQRPAKREKLRREIIAAVRSVKWPPPPNRLRRVLRRPAAL